MAEGAIDATPVSSTTYISLSSARDIPGLADGEMRIGVDSRDE